jgi:hypothetical protein
MPQKYSDRTETHMKYIPPFEAIRSMLNLTIVRGETRVAMTYDQVQQMIRTLISGIQVDEAWYLDRHEDVAAGIKNGTIRSAREHYIDHGFFEGRLPFPIPIDEKFYLDNNPDVAETVRRGVYASAQDHFDGPGYREGRPPFPLNQN